MTPRDLVSTPARHRLVLVGLALVAGAGAALYLLAGDTLAVRLGSAVLVGGAALAALAVVSGRDEDTTPQDHPRDHGQADEITADMVLAAPGGTAAGWRDGLDVYGPGYALGALQVRTNPGVWPRWPRGSRPDPVACPVCGTARGLALVWLDGRPDVATFRCPCGATWRDPGWATAAAVALVLAQDEGGGGPTPGAVRDADPGVAYVAEMLRREAGNTPPPSGGAV